MAAPLRLFGARASPLLFRAGLFAALTCSLAAQNVTVTETATEFTLANGTLTARVSKRNGDLLSLQYRGVDTLNDKSGHAGGYWSHDTTGGTDLQTRVTIDPKTNGGARGEVSVKGISGGKRMGHGPGVPQGAEGDIAADIEIRWSLGRGESGIATYCIFEHRPEYPGASMTEARFAAKLADMFDWMTIDEKRDRAFPANLHEGDKYIYTAVQFDHPVYGWSSPKEKTGFWLINPSAEYLSGGPTKVEFLCHRDTTPVAAPIVLNYWRSSHYGGALVEVGDGEPWTKVIGPFVLYVNSGGDQHALWRDAQQQAAKEARAWPYDWVSGVDYPHRNERGTVTGRLALKDPQAKTKTLPNLLVGLTPAAYTSPYVRPPAPAGKGPPGPTGPRQIDWQTDAKHYEFWVRGDESGRFTIANVRPGTYTLRAFADGVLGELARADVKVAPGKPLDLGNVDWTPVRRGQQLWEIGVPNRNGSEFAGGDDYADPEISLKYAQRFPRDVSYTIGRSDFRRDWFFQQVPHNENPAAKAEPYFGVRSAGRATPFTINFDAPSRVTAGAKAVLRVAICGSGARELDVSVNGQPAGKVAPLMNDGAITRHSIQGLWYEREVAFDAALLKPGANTLTLTVPAGPINNGVIYDYLRLELAGGAL